MNSSASIISRLSVTILCGFSFCAAVGMDLNAQTITIAPGDTIQTAVDGAPAGTKFIVQAGTYRMQTVVPKAGDIFSGQGTVVMNGSQLLTFTADPKGTGLWVAAATPDSTFVGTCDNSHPMCGYAQDLFIDSVVQSPVASIGALNAGTWYFDRKSGLVYVSSDPAGHTLELGMTQYAFQGKVNNVQITGITVEKYATPAENGAIGGPFWNLGTGWIINSCESRLNHGAGVTIGTSGQLLNSFIHNNGQLGVKVYMGTASQVINNELSLNNYSGFLTTWEAGASKFWGTTNLLVQSNYVHDNNGKGLWGDTNNVGTIYEQNNVVNNAGVGIQHEVSYAATIRNNTLKGNAPSPTTWIGDAQIRVMSSPNVEVTGNTVEVAASGGNGIAVINITRGTGTLGPWVAANNYVHDNIITYLGPTGASGVENDTAGSTATVNNRFDSNTYVLPDCSVQRWIWLNKVDWVSLQALSQELHGKYTVSPPVNPNPPAASLSAVSATLGKTYVGATSPYQAFSLANTGQSPLVVCSIVPGGANASSFSVPSSRQSCGIVAAGSSCTFDVAFKPTSVGSLSAQIVVNDNAPSGSQSIAVSGVGMSSANTSMSVSPTSYAFPTTTVGASAPINSFTLTNTGKTTLSMSIANAAGAGATSFAVPMSNQLCVKVASGASCTFGVAFTPSVTGNLSSSIQVTDSATGTTQTVAVSGSAIASQVASPALLASPASFSFPSTQNGSTAALKSFTLTNKGTASVKVNAISITGIGASSFAIPAQSQGCATISAGSTCTFYVAFTPLSSGVLPAAITVASSASGSMVPIAVSGMGTPSTSTATLSPTSFTFGTTIIGGTAAYQSFSVKNTGTIPMTISSIASSGTNGASFWIPANHQQCGVLAAGATCTFDVAFTPTAVGNLSGAIELSGNFTTSPASIAVAGICTPLPTAQLSATTFNFVSTNVGSVAPYQMFTLTNTGLSPLKVASVALTGAGAGSFAIPSNHQLCTTIAPGANCKFAVAFSPTAKGALSASFVISDNAVGGSQTLTVSGTGN